MFEVDVAKAVGSSEIALAFASDARVTALTGPSGVGKTTVLNMIAGSIRPGRGRIAVGGRLLFDSARGVDLPPEERRCGYVFQDDRLFPHLPVRRNLLYGHRLAPAEARQTDPGEVIDLLGLQPLLARRPRTLSGGEARRVAIGRALLSGPAFLLLDEPLTSLDPGRREDILSAVERIRDRFALPILYVSHQEAEVERIAGQVVTMPAR
ncbi:MAG: Molybdenum ABC transporter ATP-binding protein ModC [uncultured Sphingomonas sp.]|uniref:Molybdenum ABC transporter ATP-binding protein ModC n=1 Tax=uncultured Sphingomonas sp. TaxID=158754 RepID=A0A6J4TMD5_9SPHN|nr:MAG: Molybdenum ABC transporter ATP-binding protein ModC [uncultured Sphingomonas sp.]